MTGKMTIVITINTMDFRKIKFTRSTSGSLVFLWPFLLVQGMFLMLMPFLALLLVDKFNSRSI
jgi:hypothetical protein